MVGKRDKFLFLKTMKEFTIETGDGRSKRRRRSTETRNMDKEDE